MNIGILGGGTASAVVLLQAIERLSEGVTYCCIHDPNIPSILVGESTSPRVYQIYSLVFDVKYNTKDLEEFDGTYRYYNKYHWNKANGNDFSVHHVGGPGIHLNSEKFSSVVLKKLTEQYSSIFSEVHDTILSVTQNDSMVTVNGSKNNYKFDYVIDCRGTPTEDLNNGDYNFPLFQAVNSVILYPDFTNYDEMYTSSYIHDNGWMFGVPLQHRKTFGYLYNNNITTQEDACRDFEKIKNIDTTNLRKFSWKQYYRKKAMDGRILSMGNRLYFFEPSQALPLHYYSVLTDIFINEVDQATPEQLNEIMNKDYNYFINTIQDLIALNYVGKNSLDTNFWNYTKDQAKKQLLHSHSFQEWLMDSKFENNLQGYFTHTEDVMEGYISGFKIDLNSLYSNSAG
jgi:hypothetical protein